MGEVLPRCGNCHGAGLEIKKDCLFLVEVGTGVDGVSITLKIPARDIDHLLEPLVADDHWANISCENLASDKGGYLYRASTSNGRSKVLSTTTEGLPAYFPGWRL